MVTLEGIFLWTNHPYHEAQGLVRKRVGHWTILRAVETPVPDSKSNPIQWKSWAGHSFLCLPKIGSFSFRTLVDWKLCAINVFSAAVWKNLKPFPKNKMEMEVGIGRKSCIKEFWLNAFLDPHFPSVYFFSDKMFGIQYLISFTFIIYLGTKWKSSDKTGNRQRH